MDATLLQMKVAEVQEALLAAHPRLPVLLQEIHRTLKADPTNVTLLSEEEIGILVSGLQKQTQVEIATTMTKAKAGKALKNIAADDL